MQPSLFHFFLLTPLCLTASLLSQDFQVVSGSASATQAGQLTTIENSPHAILHWDDFSIAAKHHVHFAQVNAASTVLNRVTGSQMSALMGTLTSNGQVYLLNPHGVLIGPNAVVQTAGFLASTAHLSNDQFLAGKELLFTLPGEGKIVNQGRIDCSDGNIFLIAKDVVNTGSCSADFIGIGSGLEVLIQPHSTQRLYIRPDPVNVGEVVNAGSLEAFAIELRSSSAYEKAIRVEGGEGKLMTRVEGGRVILSAEAGGVEVDGTIAAAGGEVQVLGKEIHLGSACQIDTSGDTGGTVYVGGGGRGQDPNIFNADNVSVEKGALISADGTMLDGGTVIVWSNEVTDFHGHISVQGERNGGFVEVSGKENVIADVFPVRWGRTGKIGHFLIDPGAVTITAGANSTNPFGADYVVAQLALGDFTIDTAVDGTVGAETLTVTGTANITWPINNLTLNAGQNVVIQSGAVISCTSTGNLTITANGVPFVPGTAFAGISINNATLSCANGNMTLTGTGGDDNTVDGNSGIFITGASALVTSANGSITMTGFGVAGLINSNGISIGGQAQITSTGTGPTAAPITMTGTGGVSGNQNFGIWLNNVGAAAQITSIDGPISLNGTGGTGGSDKAGVVIVGPIISTGIGADASSITITGMGGAGASSCHGIYFPSSIGYISSSIGTISLNGTGGGTATGSYGILLQGGAYIESTGIVPHILSCGPSMTTSTICLVGQGSTAGIDDNHGILFTGSNSHVTSLNGAIALESTGGGNGTGTNNYGVLIDSSTSISSTGTAVVSIIGTGGNGTFTNIGIGLNSTLSTIDGSVTLLGTGGGDGTGDSNHGVVQSSGVVSSSGTAPISITGLGGNGVSTNFGIQLTNTASITSVDGPITLTGTGTGTTNNNYGVYLSSSSVVSSTGMAATISITGFGGAATVGNNNIGIEMESDAQVNTVDGTLTLTGTGGGSGNGNCGIGVTVGTSISSTGLGTIHLIGTGSATGVDAATGIIGQTTITSVDALIDIQGTGTGSGSSNLGIFFIGTVVDSTGTGPISLVGQGGPGLSSCTGISLNNTQIGAVNGTISLDGTGNGGDGGIGILLASSSQIQSTGSAPTTLMCGMITPITICLTGQGSTVGVNTNYGISLTDAGTLITSSVGNISLQGTGGGDPLMAGSLNDGVNLGTASVISSTGVIPTVMTPANIFIIGQGGGGTSGSNMGISMTNTATVTAVDGAISFDGTGGMDNTSDGIDINGGSIVSSTGATPNILSCGSGMTPSTICLIGLGGAGTNNTVGINISDMNTQVTSVNGPISLDGTGQGAGITNYGTLISTSAQVISTGTAPITIQGTGGNGTNSNWGILILSSTDAITSIDGEIVLNGTGGAGSTTNNHGVVFFSSTMTSTGTTASAAPISITGTGGAGTDGNLGIWLNASTITAQAGTISLDGTGVGSGATNYGINLTGGAQIQSQGTTPNTLPLCDNSTICLIGEGSSGTGGGNNGIYLTGVGVLVTSVNGPISFQGTGNGTGGNNIGSQIDDSAQVTSTGTAPISIIGQGSTAGTDSNYGIYLTSMNTLVTSVNGQISLEGTGGGTAMGNSNYGVLISFATVSSTGTGVNAAPIFISGTGGNASDANYGIFLSNGFITADTGTISLDGTGAGSTTTNLGINLNGGSQITSTGLSPNLLPCGAGMTPATICLVGHGSTTGTNTNFGINLTNTNTLISSVNGPISLEGTGGGGGSNNYGVRLLGTATISSTGTGASAASISITGTGGAASGNNYGINLDQGIITANDGTIALNGTGHGTATNNYGIYLQNAAQIQSTGTTPLTLPLCGSSTICLVGQGSTAGTDANYGIYLTDMNTLVTSANGPISLEGTGGGTATENNGVRIENFAMVTSTTSAPISITGTGGNGTDGNIGVRIDFFSKLNTQDGAVTILGTGSGTGNDNTGIRIRAGSLLTSTGTGTLSFTGNGSMTGISANYGIQIDNFPVISSQYGTITMMGIGGGDPILGTTQNYGVLLKDTGTIIQSTGATLPMMPTPADIVITGIGGQGTDINIGVVGNSGNVQILTQDGNISITGTGNGTGINNDGIDLDAATQISSSGTGTILLTGTGSSTGSSSCRGIFIINSSVVTSISGAVSLNGTGGNGAGSNNYGVWVQTSSQITSTGMGPTAASLSIVGMGGNTAGGSNVGVLLDTSAAVITIDGTISINGTGNGTGSDNYGVYLTGASTLVSSTSSGQITLSGIGGGTTTNNTGVRINSAAMVTSATSAPISIMGTGGSGTTTNHGINIIGPTSAVTTVGGNVIFNGTGAGSGGTNRGVEISAAGSVSSSGAGTLSLTGQGGATGSDNYGVYLTNAGTLVSSTSTGQITLTGTGGGTTTNNHGVYIFSSSTVQSTATAPISIVGTGGHSDGIQINSATVTTVDGPLTFNGTATGTLTDNRGIAIFNSGTVSSTGLTSFGSITMTGIGSTAGTSGNHGIFISDAGTTITSATSNIVLTGTGNGSTGDNRGVTVESGATITSSGVGLPNLLLNLLGTGDSFLPNSWGVQVSGSGTVVSGVDAALLLSGASPGISTNGVLVTTGAIVETTGAVGSIGLQSNPFLGQQGDIQIDTGARVTSSNLLYVLSSRDLILAGGTNPGENALLQHTNSSAHFGVVGNVTLQGGSGSGTEACIQPLGGSAGLIFDYVQGNVALTGGSGLGAHAQIGAIAAASSGIITFTSVSGTLSVTATDTNSFAAIGHGLPSVVSTLSGDIAMSVTGDITIQGATTDSGGGFGFAQIGHIDRTGGGSSLSGNITMQTQGSLNIMGGSGATTAYAQVGLGGQNVLTPVTSSTVLLIAGVNCSLTAAMGGGDAIILNNNSSPGGGDVTIVVDNLFPTAPLFGAGAFTFGSTVTATGNLKIYTATQGQNTGVSGATINGVVFTPGTLFVDTTTEQWDTYYPGGTYAGSTAFKFYYKNNATIPPVPPPPTPPAPPNPTPAVVANQGTLANLVSNFISQQTSPQLILSFNLWMDNLLFCDFESSPLMQEDREQ